MYLYVTSSIFIFQSWKCESAIANHFALFFIRISYVTYLAFTYKKLLSRGIIHHSLIRSHGKHTFELHSQFHHWRWSWFLWRSLLRTNFEMDYGRFLFLRIFCYRGSWHCHLVWKVRRGWSISNSYQSIDFKQYWDGKFTHWIQLIG